MAEFGVPAALDEAGFRDALFQMVMSHGVMPTVSVLSFASIPGEHPCAHALARWQARSQNWVVSGARHVAIDLDAAGRTLLGALDGSRTLDELATFMQAELAKTGLDLPLDQLRELTAQQLWLFARQGLLRAAC